MKKRIIMAQVRYMDGSRSENYLFSAIREAQYFGAQISRAEFVEAVIIKMPYSVLFYMDGRLQ